MSAYNIHKILQFESEPQTIRDDRKYACIRYINNVVHRTKKWNKMCFLQYTNRKKLEDAKEDGKVAAY